MEKIKTMPSCDNCTKRNLADIPQTLDQEIITSNDKRSLRAILRDTVLELKEQKDLFYLEVGERAVAHQFARILFDQLKYTGWSVDCEYNRAGSLTKQLSRDYMMKSLNSLRGKIPFKVTAKHFERARIDIAIETSQGRYRRVVPDVVIHTRGCNCRNVLIIEMKVNFTNAACLLLDWTKLLLFTESSEPVKSPIYRFGLFLSFNREGDAVGWEVSNQHPAGIQFNLG